MRVGFFGLFGVGNFGNDGSLKAVIELVRRARPDAKLVCYCGEPEKVGATFGLETRTIKPRTFGVPGRFFRLLLAAAVSGLNFSRAVFHTRRVDVMIVPGTGILDDFGCRPHEMPLDIFTWCLAARLTRTPVWFVSIGAGPITNPISRWLMVSAAKLADYRSYRDAVSKEFLSKHGVDTRRDPIFPDIAFDLPRPAPNPTDALAAPRVVGVGVMDYWGWKRSLQSDRIRETYEDGLARFCQSLLEEGWHIRLIQGDDADRRAIQRLIPALKACLSDGTLSENVHAEQSNNLADVMRQMADCDAIVATRYHNVVCALMMGKPILSLSYAEKNAALLRDAGLGPYADHVEQFDVALLKERFEKLLSERATLSQSISEFNATTRERLQHQEELLRARLHVRSQRRLFDGGAAAAVTDDSEEVALRRPVPGQGL